MKILMIAPEVSPFVKVGGLSDVVGALPKELEKLGHDVRVICPYYKDLKLKETTRAIDAVFSVHLKETHWARLWESVIPDTRVPVYFVEHNSFFDRAGIYTGAFGESFGDNDKRYAFLSRAGIDLCYFLDWVPDVIHCHDWTTGFVPAYLNTTEKDKPLGKAATVFTIHNLQHQGYCHSSIIDFAGLPWWLYRPDGYESMGGVNMMKGALFHATKLTTVSPNYAQEIKTPEQGFGLDPVLRFRAADLIGIINGIDSSEWNPDTDMLIPERYSIGNMDGKAVCKEVLQHNFHLPVHENVPLYGIVSRLYEQKGLDLLAQIIPHLLKNMNIQICLLGAGDPWLENEFRTLASRYEGFGCYIGYDHRMSHLIEAGSDFFIMPSRFEPCGLNQMYSMIYGTLPIVRATGGLVDTVKQYNEATGEGTGFVFSDATVGGLYDTIGWSCATYWDKPDAFRKLQQQAMQSDFSWKSSTEKYVQTYKWAVEQRRKLLL